MPLTQKRPAAVATAGPGETQGKQKHTTGPSGGEQQQLSLFTFEAPPHNATPTSREAAKRIKRHAPTQRDCVHAFIRERGDYGCTDEEVQDALELKPHSETPRRGELVKLGLIVDSGRTRPTSSGRPAIVWVAAVEAKAKREASR